MDDIYYGDFLLVHVQIIVYVGHLCMCVCVCVCVSVYVGSLRMDLRKDDAQLKNREWYRHIFSAHSLSLALPLSREGV